MSDSELESDVDIDVGFPSCDDADDDGDIEDDEVEDSGKGQSRKARTCKVCHISGHDR